MPWVEDAVFTALSVAVLLVVAGFLFSQPQATLTAQAAPIAAAPANQTLVYGSLLDANGQPIKNAVIQIFEGTDRVRQVRTKNDGTFSTQFSEGTETFTITVTVVVNGQSVTGTTNVVMQPGMQYGLQMVFSEPNSFVFVPIPGY